ncbi:flagellar type III secretion system pore protein FliP [Teredinibacter sp. KSP-S5-2]|uniref:flagellar type III secretion system pore protein FliP n=1 Tax=Teredinibacter sp. KSP-S5-2 TaxID=3034506 RepID=UPI002934BCCB|nr:flagellar type III secretion system pore protein FliP [Teredinibacter sp. KSP-S5-2]WNO07901.1 flagellar type III secretion system pore protein FliP [Teredinibacter sp. KSP-S5-2]
MGLIAVKKSIFWGLLFLLFFSGNVVAQSELIQNEINSVANGLNQTSSESTSVGQGLTPINGLPAITVKTNPDGSQDYTVTLQILFLMTALTFLPALLMMMTSFTRIIIVFAILRQALGLQQSPSNQIIIGLSLFLTFFIMSPVLEKVNQDALQPYINEQVSARQAFDLAKKPFHQFMLANTRETDLDLFFRIGNLEPVAAPEEVPFNVLMPAFVTSELKTAFQIGFIIFIPFLVIDIVVASVLMAMGMMMLSPLIISLPFKIMLFVLVDGWALIIGTLAASFGI